LDADVIDYNDPDEQTASPTPASKKRTSRNSKVGSDAGPRPTQIKFYMGTWVDVLENAKAWHHLFIHAYSDNAFPECDAVSLQNAHDCLLEEITAYQENPALLPLDLGMALSFDVMDLQSYNCLYR
jgi:hypothetical protein